ncbi:MAG: hypothetical protein RIR51_12 [Bacteroidota bacterium]|jgi:hypothetical protein
MVNVLKILVKTILYGMLSLFFILFISIILLKIPSNQVRLANYFRPKIEKAINFPIELKSIQFKFSNELILNNIKIKDRQNNSMIDIKELDVNFDWIQLLFRGNRPLMSSARLIRPDVHIILDSTTNRVNMTEFVDAIVAALADPNAVNDGPSAIFTIKDVEVINGKFRLDNNNLPNQSSPDYFDIAHWGLDKIYSKVENFYVVNDTIALNVIGLKAKDEFTNVEIKKLDTKFLVSNKIMRYDDLSLYVNDSWVSDKFLITYNDITELTDFINLANMEARFKGAIVEGKDIAKFIPAMNKYLGKYRLNGRMSGFVNNLDLLDFEIGFGKSSALRGDLAFMGLPNIDNMVMDLSLVPSVFNPEDLTVFIPSSAVEKMKIIGRTTFTGDYNGTNQKFNFKGKANTQLGFMSGDLNFNLKEQTDASAYDGNIQLTGFQLGKLLKLEEYLNKINLETSIKGNGFSNQTANVEIDAYVSEIDFNDYPYKNISLKGNLSQSLFNGIVAISDTNVSLNAIGQIDLRYDIPHYSLNGIIRHSNLLPLNFSPDTLNIRTEFEGDFNFSSIDDLSGILDLTDFVLSKPGSPDLVLNELNFVSNLKNPFERSYSFDSEIMDAKVLGNFRPSSFLRDLKQMGQEFIQYFTLNKSQQDEYYQTAFKGGDEEYYADINIILKQSSQILKRWFPSLYLSDQTVLNANIDKSKYYNFSMQSYPDTMKIGDYNFLQSVFSVQSSKEFGGPGISTSLYYKSRKQQLNFLTPTENLILDALWDQDKINFITQLKQEGENNYGHLNGQWTIEKNGFNLNFKDSYFTILGQDWMIDPKNNLSFGPNLFKAQNVNLTNGDQALVVNGDISEDSTAILSLNANNFQLNTLKPLFSVPIEGNLNASLSIRDWFKDSKIDGWTTIDSLFLGNLKIGNMIGFGNYNPIEKKMELDFNFDRENQSFLVAKGTYQPSLLENYLDLNVEMNRTSVKILEPFTKGLFSKFDGYGSGYIHIGGELTNPDITGDIIVDSVQLVYDYLNQKSFVSDTVHFENRSIQAKNWNILDEEGNKAQLNARIDFQKNKPLFFELNTKFDHFKLLNTVRQPDSYYYGLGYGTGFTNVRGENNKVYIDGKIQTNDGTQIFIPLDNEEQFGTDGVGYEFLSIVKEQESRLLEDTVKKTELGIEMDMDFVVTPEAYGEVIFDSQKGDLMRIYGNGNLNMGITPKGDFTLKGKYAIEQGDYTFSLQNVFNKKFIIDRNSSISWDGDPLDGKVDIKAIYTQYASLFPILLDTTNKSNLPEFKRRYPVDVQINLANRLLSPDVSFKIGIRDYPNDVNFNSSVTAFTNRLRTDEQELTKQVSNVLLFGQLTSPYGVSNLELGNFVGNFTEMLSNQLSNLASRLNKNLSLDVYLGGGGFTQEFISNLQLRASYNFNDRFRITRSGAFTDARNQTSARLLLGDWAAEWFIKKDGSLRLKGYNRNVQTSLAGSLESYQINQTFGTSLSYQKNFNRFFWQKRKD